jgi:hypothetical protein
MAASFTFYVSRNKSCHSDPEFVEGEEPPLFCSKRHSHRPLLKLLKH